MLVLEKRQRKIKKFERKNLERISHIYHRARETVSATRIVIKQ